MTAPLSIEQIEALEALEKAATEAPWEVDPEDKAVWGRHGSIVVIDNVEHIEDAALIAALRNAAPALLARSKRKFHVAALETVRELSSKIDTTAFGRWMADYMNQQRADKAETELARARDDRNRYLAALKVEALLACDGPGDIVVIGGVSFRIELNGADELQAREVIE